ncbi:hypothetical protein ACRRTK_021911 [Alexandromys fortis]
MGLLPEPEAHQFGQALCLLSLRGPSVCPPHHPSLPVLGALLPPHPGFYVGMSSPTQVLLIP